MQDLLATADAISPLYDIALTVTVEAIANAPEYFVLVVSGSVPSVV